MGCHWIERASEFLMKPVQRRTLTFVLCVRYEGIYLLQCVVHLGTLMLPEMQMLAHISSIQLSSNCYFCGKSRWLFSQTNGFDYGFIQTVEQRVQRSAIRSVQNFRAAFIALRQKISGSIRNFRRTVVTEFCYHNMEGLHAVRHRS